MSEQTGTLEQQILEDARRQADPILRRARRQADEIVRRAEQEAATRRQETLGRAGRRAEAEAQRILARAALEAENLKRQIRESVLQQVRDRAVAALGAMTQAPHYPQMLLSLALAALKAMSGRRFELLMRHQDRQAHGETLARLLRERAAAELGRQVIVIVSQETVPAAGGLLVRRADGRQLCDQTFEARLGRLWDQLRAEIGAQLLGAATDRRSASDETMAR